MIMEICLRQKIFINWLTLTSVLKTQTGIFPLFLFVLFNRVSYIGMRESKCLYHQKILAESITKWLKRTFSWFYLTLFNSSGRFGHTRFHFQHCLLYCKVSIFPTAPFSSLHCFFSLASRRRAVDLKLDLVFLCLSFADWNATSGTT